MRSKFVVPKFIQPHSRFIAIIGIILASNLSGARPPFLKILKDTYAIKAGSDVDKAACLNCHTQVPQRNAYGKAIQAELDRQNADNLTPEILKSVEKADSDGDGYTNLEELKAGFNPGDPLSHPTAHETAAAESLKGKGGTDLIPTHTFHPALVHFPLALFLFGAMLDVLGIFRRNEGLRQAGLINIGAGAISTLLVIPTGLIACFRLGYELTPGKPVFTHFALAVSATLLMIGVVVWRKKSEPVSLTYVALIALTAAILSAAGHFGGNLVY